jgi:hypothetical protein
MNKRLTTILLGILIAASAVLSSCTDDEVVQPININFTNSEVGISSSNPSANIEITFSRAVSKEGTLTLTLNSGSLELGSDKDFEIPGATGTSFTVAYEAGAESVSFTLTAGSGLNIDQDESLTISLVVDEGSDFILGETASVTVTFSENFVAPSGSMELQGGGAAFPNQVFVDLSKLTQKAVDKYSWDLGFYSGADFRVIVNSSAAVMARPIDKTDLASVTASDTLNFASEMVTNGFATAGGAEWVDAPSGDLSSTAFGEIGTSGNKVFIVKGAKGLWKKLLISQKGENYELKFGDIEASTIQTVTISKNSNFNFSFYSFENGIVEVEPAKSSWDISYGSFTNITNYGYDVPYLFNDFITINRNGTSVAMVLTVDYTYDEFKIANIDQLTFDTNISAIGSSWRVTYPAASLKTDRFYIIKDSEGNVFKLQFDRLTSLDGERGKPSFIFENIYK